MNRLPIILLLPLLVSACATSYSSKGLTGGFSETQLAPNSWRVTFAGNGYTSRERAADFTLLRCAELALDNGFTHFVIVDASQATDHSSYTMPGSSTTQVSGYQYGNRFSATAQTSTRPGQTLHFAKPSNSNTIVCLKAAPPDGTFAYDAQFLWDSLSEKYKI